MPNYIWDLTGFCCGFLLCWLMSGVSDNGSIAPRPGDAVKAALDAWGKRVLTRLAGPGAAPRASVKDTSSGRQLSLVALVGIVVLFLAIDDGQRRGLGAAYNIEAWLAGSRSAAFLFFLIAGWAVSRFRRDLGRIITRILSSFRDEKGRFSTISQSVFIAVAGLIAFNIIDPGLFRRVTSFKAYEIEAKFGDTSGTTQQIGATFRDYHRQENLLEWQKFSYRIDEPNDIIYVPPVTGYSIDKPNWRGSVYSAANDTPPRILISQILFSNYLSPLTRVLTCLAEEHKLLVIQHDKELMEVTASFDKMIQDDKIRLDLHKNLDNENVFDGENLKNIMKKIINIFDHYVSEIDVFQNSGGAKSSCFFKNKDAIDEYRKNLNNDGVDRDLRIINGSVKCLKLIESSLKRTESIWDSYLVAYVGDLIAFIQGQGEKAQYLSGLRNYGPRTGVDEFEIPLPGFINFNYQLADAKMRSNLSWPIDDAVADIDKILLATQRALEIFKMKRRAYHADNEKVNIETNIIEVYNTFLVQNFARGLEIYYRRAMQGDKINKIQIDHWRNWLGKSRAYLSIIENFYFVHKIEPYALDAEDRHDLLISAPKIPASAILDLEIGTALSLVLIPRYDGQDAGGDCVQARELIDHARREDRLKAIYTDEDLPTINGVLEEFGSQIDAACAK